MNRPSGTVGIIAALVCAACSEQVSLVAPFEARPTDQALGSAAALTRNAGQAVPSTPGAHALPFKGRFDGTQTVTPLTPPLASVEVSATGTATRLGRFTIELPHTVNFATATAQGTCTMVAANGDVLIADFTGQAQVGPIVSIVEHATIKGGTGRFASATGSFTITRVFDPAAGTTSGAFEGTISAPGGGW